MNPKTKSVLFAIFLVLIFALTAIIILFLVNGYRFNWSTKKVVRTGTIILDGNQNFPLKIFLDSELKAITLPTRFNYLLPGSYDLKIEVKDYYSWEKVGRVEERRVTALEKILLFKNREKLDFVLADKDDRMENSNSELEIRGSELWNNDKLLSRYSENIVKTFWFYDDNHLILQVGQELLSLEIDSLQTQKLYLLLPGEEFKGVDKYHLFILRGKELWKARII